jgi:GxxExxY protein
MPIGLLYEELTEKILHTCFDVSNELGAGFLESVYQNALIIALSQVGLNAQAQVPINVSFRNQVVGQFFADVLVDDKVLVELKAVSGLRPEHQAQVLNYLHASQIEVGLLVNFGRPRIEYQRLDKPIRTTKNK